MKYPLKSIALFLLSFIAIVNGLHRDLQGDEEIEGLVGLILDFSLVEGEEIKIVTPIAKVDGEDLEDGFVTFDIPNVGVFLDVALDGSCANRLDGLQSIAQLDIVEGKISFCFNARDPAKLSFDVNVTTLEGNSTESVISIEVEEDTFVVFEYIAMAVTIGGTLACVLFAKNPEDDNESVKQDGTMLDDDEESEKKD